MNNYKSEEYLLANATGQQTYCNYAQPMNELIKTEKTDVSITL
jgi:hypothetical protein